MPTRRGSRRTSQPTAAGEAVRSFGQAVANATKTGTKKVLGGYLNATNKAADYISSKLPEKMKSVKPPMRVRGGMRKRP